ncbi:23S rRNA (uracil1939-C5)-methyltransferase [Hypnocyclicus thermotrophus]|uniref:23S rRNA (Uracil1939-C5)-methyltransferase n=1 Tax=Hypnocyclicus thermotrophus TaxID=1627895 RepID=A0AA46I6D7_9FUSO|nr:23S rRNA (uracil(1939)-C(5))-methyltransferase RlmD [Hypnocyclicus thermotrophus]TDT71562.1 23S rRNA (uracil1939-C5)-methyltransferase [Hypnocyclicus thermotrophus]
MLKIGDLIEVSIDKIVFGGEGLGYYNDIAIFVPMSVPGDKLKVEIISNKKTYARGLIKKVIKPSIDRVSSEKISFEDYHGCDFAMINYEKQIEYKKEMVKEVFSRIAKIDNIQFDKVLLANTIFNYRNKVIEQIGYRNGKVISGFYKRRSHEIFEVKDNYLQPKEINKIFTYLKNRFSEKKLTIYDERKHKGMLRNLMARVNSNGEIMLVVIIKGNIIKELKKILKDTYNKYKNVISIYISINNNKTNFALGNKNILLYGEETIKENLFDINFNISPTSFFQINIEQTKKLYELAISYFNNINNKNIVDAYSGTGTIGMILSKQAKKIFSIELAESSSKDAEKTAKENNISNITFINDTVENGLTKLLNSDEKIDSIIFDPPRKGIDKNSLQEVIDKNINELVYISCNPSTLARDIGILVENGYKLMNLSIVDMFPQTSHVETVVLMSRV